MGGFSGTSEIGNQSLQRLPEASRIAIKTFDALLRLRTWELVACLVVPHVGISLYLG